MKPHVERRKADAADAAAICEVVTRSNMPSKTSERQHRPMLHRTRNLLTRQTVVVSAILAHPVALSVMPDVVDARIKGNALPVGSPLSGRYHKALTSLLERRDTVREWPVSHHRVLADQDGWIGRGVI